MPSITGDAPDYDLWEGFHLETVGVGVPTNHNGALLLAEEPPSTDTDSWTEIDLGPYIEHTAVRATPSVGIARDDGLRLIYPGKEHACIGEMESGKSWLAVASVAAELTAGHHVIYIHFEESDPQDTVDRLLDLGVPGPVINTHLHFFGPDRPMRTPVMERMLSMSPTLVVLDGVNEAMSMHGHEIRQEDGAAAFRRILVKPFTRAGAATLALDHVVKDRDGRGRYALGSIHKGNGLTGVQISLENKEPFGRGMRGCSFVNVLKDRPGHLRRHGQADKKLPGVTYMGALIVDDSQLYTPELTLKFHAPKEDAAPSEKKDTRPVALMSEIAALLTTLGPLSGRQIENHVTGNAAEIRKANKLLAKDGFVTLSPGRNRSIIHALTTPFTEDTN